jgi:hypothetical protein
VRDAQPAAVIEGNGKEWLTQTASKRANAVSMKLLGFLRKPISRLRGDFYNAQSEH